MSGFCAETGGGLTILLASRSGIPVSTTHTITGAIFGVGLTRRMFNVRWSIGVDIATAWVLTLPAAAILAIGVFLILKPVIAALGLG
jgi:PiT family inorganic phosphate transporter